MCVFVTHVHMTSDSTRTVCDNGGCWMVGLVTIQQTQVITTNRSNAKLPYNQILNLILLKNNWYKPAGIFDNI